jgi:type II secretory pathway predicted ATPase ExeA
LSVDKDRTTLPTLIAALFYDLSPDKEPRISKQGERRERDLQELFRRGRKPVALFVDEAHDLHAKTLSGLKRLMEVVADGGGMLSIVLAGHPKLRNDLRRPTMEEIGYRATVFLSTASPATNASTSIGCSKPAPRRKRSRQS